eukprot:748256-Hanusia_phi.AAC.2
MTRLPGVPQILQAAGQLPPPREEGGRELRVGYISSNLQGGAVFLMIQVPLAPSSSPCSALQTFPPTIPPPALTRSFSRASGRHTCSAAAAAAAAAAVSSSSCSALCVQVT